MKKNIDRFIRKSLLLSSLFILLGFFISCTSDGDASKLEIKSFCFSVEKNDFLYEDVNGIIDNEKKLINCVLPEEVYNDEDKLEELQMDITLSENASLIEKEYNFRNSPVVIGISSENGDCAVYTVVLSPSYSQISRGKLIFTRYYSQNEYEYKGEANNQVVEIFNCSDEEIDLSGVTLKRCHWEKGKRVPSKDVSVNLSGKLGVWKFFTLCSKSCESKDKFVSDENFGEILQMNGIDGLQLWSGDELLDVFGPNQGEGNGSFWGSAKLIELKESAFSSAKENPDFVTAQWDESRWIQKTPEKNSNDYANFGKQPSASKSNAKNITYLALENTPQLLLGYVQRLNEDDDPYAYYTGRLRFNIPSNYDMKQVVTISTDGLEIRDADGFPIVSGELEIDFSKISEREPIDLQVVDGNGDVTVWYLYAEEVAGIEYTDVNYDFDGGIKNFLNGKGSDITGVLTCRNFKNSKDSNSFFIQDKDAAVYVYIAGGSSLPSNALVGNKVRLTGAKKGAYGGMTEVTGFTSVEVVDVNIYPIYYETVDKYDFKTCGKVCLYDEVIEDSTNLLSEKSYMYDCQNGAGSAIQPGNIRKIYAPVLIKNNTEYHFIITDKNQVKLP